MIKCSLEEITTVTATLDDVPVFNFSPLLFHTRTLESANESFYRDLLVNKMWFHCLLAQRRWTWAHWTLIRRCLGVNKLPAYGQHALSRAARSLVLNFLLQNLVPVSFLPATWPVCCGLCLRRLILDLCRLKCLAAFLAGKLVNKILSALRRSSYVPWMLLQWKRWFSTR